MTPYVMRFGEEGEDSDSAARTRYLVDSPEGQAIIARVRELRKLDKDRRPQSIRRSP